MKPYDFVYRLIGEVEEIPGVRHHPFIQWCHESVGFGPESPDEVPWCSSLVNRVCWIFRLPRSKSAAARSWLKVGTEITLASAEFGDIIVLKRGSGVQPGPEVLQAPGHVGFYAGVDGDSVLVLGGNQGDNVSVARFPKANILGVRRLA